MQAGPTWMAPGVPHGTTVVEVATSPPAYSVPSGPKTASPSSQTVTGKGAGCQLDPPLPEAQPPHVSGTGEVPLKTSGTGKMAPSTYNWSGLTGLTGFTAISGSPIVRLLPFPEMSISNSARAPVAGVAPSEPARPPAAAEAVPAPRIPPTGMAATSIREPATRAGTARRRRFI